MAIEPVRIDLVAPRNGMPSLHAAWAYLVWFNAANLPTYIRRGFRAFVILTLVATIGLRDAHWLTDLFVALPMAIALQAAFTTGLSWRGAARWRVVIGGAVLVAVWFAVLRLGVSMVLAWPGLSWALVAASCAISVALFRDLERARARASANWAIGQLAPSSAD
jgi:hypothetical protein